MDRMKEGALEKTEQGQDSSPYEHSARALAERAKHALEGLTRPGGARADVYPQGKEGVDFLVKFYDNKRSFEAHCSGASCDLFQVVNNGQTLAPIAWEGEGGGHGADVLTEEVLREAILRAVEENKNIAAGAVFTAERR